MLSRRCSPRPWWRATVTSAPSFLSCACNVIYALKNKMKEKEKSPPLLAHLRIPFYFTLKADSSLNNKDASFVYHSWPWGWGGWGTLLDSLLLMQHSFTCFLFWPKWTRRQQRFNLPVMKVFSAHCEPLPSVWCISARAGQCLFSFSSGQVKLGVPAQTLRRGLRSGSATTATCQRER